MGTYPIDRNNLHVIFLRHMFRGFALVMTVTAAITYLAGADPVASVGVLVFAAFTATIPPWTWGGLGRGNIELDSGGVRVRSKVATFFFPWAHILGVRVGSANETKGLERLLLKLLLVPTSSSRVQIDLDRWIRRSIWRAQFGTAETGLPTFTKKYYVYAENPTAVAADIRTQLTQMRGESIPNVDPLT